LTDLDAKVCGSLHFSKASALKDNMGDRTNMKSRHRPSLQLATHPSFSAH
jgi:hypothetical protein